MMTSGLPLRLLVPLYQLHLCAKKGLCQIGDQRDSWLTICLSKRAENFAYGHKRNASNERISRNCTLSMFKQLYYQDYAYRRLYCETTPIKRTLLGLTVRIRINVASLLPYCEQHAAAPLKHAIRGKRRSN
jgi:hypothetical protein